MGVMKLYRVASTGTAHLTDAVDPVCGARVGAGTVTWGDVTCKRCLKWVESRKAREASEAPAEATPGHDVLGGNRYVDSLISMVTEMIDAPKAEAADGTRVGFIMAATGERREGTVTGRIVGEFGRVALRVRDDRGALWSPWEADCFPAATVRDDAQDALDAEQERTGIHAGCGMRIDARCGRCDVCPTDRGGCHCDVDPDDELTTIAIGPYTGPGTVTVVPTPTADDVARMADPVKWVNDTLALETLRLDKPAQVCVCGMMPGARFHKRHCPTGTGDATRVDFIPATERRALVSMPIDAPRATVDGSAAPTAKRVQMRRWSRRVKPSIGRNRKGR